MTSSITQRSLFGAKDTVHGASDAKSVKPKAAPAAKAPFPKLLLSDGLDSSVIKAEAVFWHRLIANQFVNTLGDEKSKRKFIRVVLSEMKLKQGRKTPEILMRDMLLMKNLG
jgi:hypothetical protein